MRALLSGILLVCAAAPAQASGSPGGVALEQRHMRVSVTSRAAGTNASHMLGKVLWKSWTSSTDDRRPAMTVRFGQTRYVSAIAIRPGDLRNGTSYKAVRRPARIEVRWGGQKAELYIPDTPKLHVLALPELIGADEMKIRFTRFYGPQGRGVAVSQFVVYEPADVLATRPDLRARIEATAKKRKHARTAQGRGRLGQKLASYGTPAVPWLMKMTSQLSGNGLRIALRALAAIDIRHAKRAIDDVISRPPMSRRNVGLKVANDNGISFRKQRLVSLLMRDRASVLDAALTSLCREQAKYALRAVERAIESRSRSMLAVVPECLGNFGPAGYSVAQAMLTNADSGVVIAGIKAHVTLANADAGSFATRAVESLSAFVQAPNRKVSRVAANALASIGTPGAAAALLKVVMSGKRANSKTAIGALAVMKPAPNEALSHVLGRGPAYDAAPIIESLIRRKTDTARKLLLSSIASASYMSWWDMAVAGFVGQGKPAFQAAAAWMRSHPRRSRNILTALQNYARRAAPHMQSLLLDLPASRTFDNLRIGLAKLIAKGQPNTWIATLSALTGNQKLSARSRIAGLEGLAKAEVQDVDAMRAAKLAVGDHVDTVSDAGRRTAALLGDRAAVESTVQLLRKTPATSWRVTWIHTLAAFPDVDSDYLLTTRFPGARNDVQSAVLELLSSSRRQRGVEHVMQIAITPDHPLRVKALALLGYR